MSTEVYNHDTIRKDDRNLTSAETLTDDRALTTLRFFRRAVSTMNFDRDRSFTVIRQGAPLLHSRKSETLNHQPRMPIAIFELAPPPPLKDAALKIS